MCSHSAFYYFALIKVGPLMIPGSRVSAKIQQLLNTLKRPKRKPLQEFFQDEEEELEGKSLLHDGQLDN